MSQMKNSKVVLVTGTSTGIGQSTAVRLARAGYAVVATMRDLGKADALRDRATREQVTLDIRQLDVCDPASIQTCVDSVLATYGHVDVLVNNAGAGYLGTFEQTSFADLQKTMDVNFHGVVRMTQALFPRMRLARSGRIVTVTSVGGLVGQPFNDAYCAAKFAVEGLMESLAPVARHFGIDIALVEPGAVSTEFVANLGDLIAARQADVADPYAPLLATYIEGVSTNYSASQTPDEVAEVVLEAVSAERPHLRYLTSDAVRAFASVKHDATGDRVLALTSAWLAPA